MNHYEEDARAASTQREELDAERLRFSRSSNSNPDDLDSQRLHSKKIANFNQDSEAKYKFPTENSFEMLEVNPTSATKGEPSGANLKRGTLEEYSNPSSTKNANINALNRRTNGYITKHLGQITSLTNQNRSETTGDNVEKMLYTANKLDQKKQENEATEKVTQQPQLEPTADSFVQTKNDFITTEEPSTTAISSDLSKGDEQTEKHDSQEYGRVVTEATKHDEQDRNCTTTELSSGLETTDKMQNVDEEESDQLLGAHLSHKLKSESTEEDESTEEETVQNYSTTTDKTMEAYTENILGAARSSETNDRSSEESDEDVKNYSAKPVLLEPSTSTELTPPLRNDEAENQTVSIFLDHFNMDKRHTDVIHSNKILNLKIQTSFE